MNELPKVEIEHNFRGECRASIGSVANTGHKIELAGHFRITSIMNGREKVLPDFAAAEEFISQEWQLFLWERAPKTTRELDAMWDGLTPGKRIAEINLRHVLAFEHLDGMLSSGDRLRGNNSMTCETREASYTFSHWAAGRMIASTGGKLIDPGSVYSVNSKVLRF